jgi:hypothetical protein
MYDENLFHIIMEAGGNLVEPFDLGGADMNAGMDVSSGAPPDASTISEPPPLDNSGDITSMDSMGFDMGDGGNVDMGMGEDMGMAGAEGQQEEGTQNPGSKLSEKANTLLNQKLYTQMLERNQEIEDAIESINRIVPLLPYKTIRENDENMTRLKSALDKGKSYLIQNFVDAKYGENLVFFQKLDALYTLLVDQINENLKQLKNSDEM